MAETIRDVVIRVSLKLADDKALKSGAAQIRQATTEQIRMASVTKQTAGHHKTIADMERRGLLFLREQMAYYRHRESRLKSEIELEKQRLHLQRQQMMFAGPARGAGGAGGAIVPVGAGVVAGAAGAAVAHDTLSAAHGRPTKLRDPSITIGGTELKISKLFAATLIVARLPDVFQKLASGELIRDAAAIGVGLADTARELGGLTRVALGINARPGQEANLDDQLGFGLGGALAGGTLGMRGGVLTTLLGTGIGLAIGTALGQAKIAETARQSGVNMPTPEQSRQAEYAGLLNQQASLYRSQADAIKEIIATAYEEVRAKREVIKAERESAQHFRQGFAMLSPREQTHAFSLAKRFRDAGDTFKGFSQKNMEDFERFGLVSRIPHDVLVKLGKSQIADDIDAVMGQDKRLNKLISEEAALEAKARREASAELGARLGVDIKTKFDLTVKVEKFGDEFLKEFKPLFDKAQKELHEKVMNELARLKVQIAMLAKLLPGRG